jgi:hypothetical protein
MASSLTNFLILTSRMCPSKVPDALNSQGSQGSQGSHANNEIFKTLFCVHWNFPKWYIMHEFSYSDLFYSQR